MPSKAIRFTQWLLIGIASVLLAVHGAGWVAAALFFWRRAVLYMPPAQSAVVLGLALVVLRAGSVRRRSRRLVIVSVLVVTAVAFVALPLPKKFGEQSVMPGGAGTASSRSLFESRFPLGQRIVNFHSHLGDVVMGTLDVAFGGSDSSPARAYDALSRLAGLLFLLELGVAAAWHQWSRRSCRYVGLAIGTPVCLLYFGYWDLGYLSVAVGVVPLLAIARTRPSVQADASTLVAGFLQGLHTALYGFGVFGLAGGALAALSGRGEALRRLLRSATFASAGVALYLGWIFLYVPIAGLHLAWARQLGYRPIVEAMLFDHRIANPLLSQAGLGEFGLFSALSGVPLLALSMLTSHRAALVPAILFGLPGLLFLVRWWPVSAPYNLDLLLSVFPGLFAACWVLASSRVKSMSAFALLLGLHVLLWTAVGTGAYDRVWTETLP